MSLTCGVECVLCVGCTRWAWKRCTHVGSDDSISWPLATSDEFEPIPRICRIILAVYEEDLRLQPSGAGHFRINPDWVVKRVTYEQALGHAPPYVIYVDHDHREIVLAIRGLNLIKESDYKLLLNNRLGMQMFDGGYVHHGLLKSAVWLLNQESETLKRLWIESGSDYKMVFAGHSLGSGVAALLTVIVVNHRDQIGGIPRSHVRCYSIAPARCMSLNLAVKYADVVYSIVLQDKRWISLIRGVFSWMTSYQGRPPHWKIFLDLFFGLDPLDSLPCLLFFVCVRDTFIPEAKKLRDPRRLYAPGRMYHIVERKFCRCGRYPPEVRTAIPVDGRFEHIVLSCNATSDHAIIWIEREAEKALEGMVESSSETTTSAPALQKIERMQTIKKEHKDALEKAVSLNIPHAVTSSDDEHSVDKDVEHPQNEEQDTTDIDVSPNTDAEPSQDEKRDTKTKSESSGRKTNWNEVVQKLFKKNESGKLVFDRDS